jgi:deoxyribodipyrimidine photolyase-related protein
MSNYCKGCRFDPAQKTGADACPYNYVYWRFIDEHAERFGSNPRMRTVVNAWLARTDAAKLPVRESAAGFLAEHVPA